MMLALSLMRAPKIPNAKALAKAGKDLSFDIDGELASTILKVMLVVVVVALAAILLYLVVSFVVRKIRGYMAKAAMRRDLDQTQEPTRPKDNTPELLQAFQGAVEQLSRSTKGEQALHALPWYLVIGTPESGKSTLLRQSELEFPYLRGSERGIPERHAGPTEHCDWWVSDQGVFLDTAGRYTQRSADPDEWTALLSAIAKLRGEHPINGLLVTVSMESFMDVSMTPEQGGSSHHELGRTLRERVQTIYNSLGERMPVYLLVTQCDRIEGFSDLMSTLDAKARRAPLGITLPLQDGPRDPAVYLDKQFDLLCDRIYELSARATARHKQTRAPETLFGFSQRFSRQKPALLGFLSAFFHSAGHLEPVMLRGLYFASAVPQRDALDAFMRARGRNPVGPQTPSEHSQPASFFLRGLFQDLVFPDRLFVQSTQETKEHRFRRQLMWTTGVATAGLAALIIPWNAATRFEMLEQEAVKRVASLQLGQKALPNYETREAMSAYLALSRVENRIAAPKEARVAGLYWGMNKQDTVNPAYCGVMDRVVDQWARDWIEKVVQEDAATLQDAVNSYGSRPESLQGEELTRVYDALGRYLLLSKAGDLPERTEEQRTWLRAHLAPYLKQLNAVHKDEHLSLAKDAQLATRLADAAVERETLQAKGDVRLRRSARRLLRDVDREQIPIFVRDLVREVNADTKSARFTLHTFADKIALEFLHSKNNALVEGSFTRDGWETAIRDRLAQEAKAPRYLQPRRGSTRPPLWIRKLDQESWPKERHAKLRRTYWDAYEREWHRFLSGLEVQGPSDETGVLNMLEKLGDSAGSPYYALFEAVRDNASLPEAEADPEAKGEASDKEDKEDKADEHEPKPRTLSPWQPKLKSFARFGASIKGDNPDRPLPLDSYTADIADLRKAMAEQTSSPGGATIMRRTHKNIRRRTRQLIDEQGDAWRSVLTNLLEAPVQLARNYASRQRGDQLQSLWCTQVVNTYEYQLLRKYPFAASEANMNEVDLATLTSFLHPEKGDLWTSLSAFEDFIVKTGDTFTAIDHGTDAKRTINPQVINFLNRSWKLAKALFPPGSDAPRVRFEVNAPPRSGIQKLRLTLSDQSYTQLNGPPTPETFVWPADAEQHHAKLTTWFSPFAQDAFKTPRGRRSKHQKAPPRQSPDRVNRETEGVWALFKLLELNKSVDDVSRNGFTLSWEPLRPEVDPPVTLEFRAPGAMGVFFGDSLKQNALMLGFRHTEMNVPHKAFLQGGGCGY